MDEFEANSPSNLASSTTPLASRSSAPAEVRAEFFAGVAPLTMKVVPGSVWNTGASDGSLIQSCAQATRARSVSAASGLSSNSRSKRPPNSLRVSVALRELKPSAKPPPLRSVSL